MLKIATKSTFQIHAVFSKMAVDKKRMNTSFHFFLYIKPCASKDCQ